VQSPIVLITAIGKGLFIRNKHIQPVKLFRLTLSLTLFIRTENLEVVLRKSVKARSL